MDRMTGAGMALLAVMAAALTILAASFLPFFMSQAWGPLWGVEWWPVGMTRSFCRPGPFVSVSQWPTLLAIPLSGILLAAAFAIVVGVVVLKWRRAALRAG